MYIKHKSYDEYVDVQVSTNKRKLNVVWIQKETIKRIKEYCLYKKIDANNVLCHGTRNGAEQKYFKQIFNCDVLGTEISPTATQFEHTIQWDFHEINEDWIGKFDLIYSNSWDHAYDFKKALTNWMRCLTSNGRVVIEYTASHRKADDKADCFGLSKPDLIQFIENCGFTVESFFDAKINSPQCPKTELIFIKL